MSKSIFNPAIQYMKSENINFYGSLSFQEYLMNNNLPKAKTAEYISVDSYEKLNKTLKENNTMVLRLGKAEGIGTQFALAKVSDVKDFFIIDSEVLKEEGQTYLPTKSIRQLFAYQVLPFLSESSYVNLGVASGLVSYALGLDEDNIPLTPATGKSTFTFKLKPHSSIDKILTHNNGQVEVDGVFVAEKDGKQTVFVLEAKSDEVHKSLAKHKLVYPILSIAQKVPRDMPIIPVYMKVYKKLDGIHYHIVECEFLYTRNEVLAINELKVKKSSHLILPIFELK